MSKRLPPALSFATVLALGGLVYAAGSGAPARGIPYSGVLELDGNPVSEAGVPMTFTFHDDATAGALLHQETLAVDVDAGRFQVVLGRDGAPLPETVFNAAELFVSVDVDGVQVGDRRQIYALPQTVRAGQALSLEVADGKIYQGTPPDTLATDLGLYSGVSGKHLRLVTNQGRLRVFSDGNTSNGYGGNADFEVRSDGTTVFGNHRVAGSQTIDNDASVSGNHSVGGRTTTGDLTVTGRAFGAPFSPAVNQDFTMATDGFVTFSVRVPGNGPRGDAEIRINNVTVAHESVHFFTPSDTFVRSASLSVAVRRNDVVRLVFTPSSGPIADFDFLTRVVPFAP